TPAIARADRATEPEPGCRTPPERAGKSGASSRSSANPTSASRRSNRMKILRQNAPDLLSELLGAYRTPVSHCTGCLESHVAPSIDQERLGWPTHAIIDGRGTPRILEVWPVAAVLP